ncbi:FAD-dependent oxidoreductase [Mesorhizobium sp. B292B1B]|uniref:FAD-dependent oxidoreductase n=1 Tax=unclassified Mesorhizobium TaxID=325217 RepID=UPI0015E2EBB0|nr:MULTISPECIES: FAD-dependent oxidoreductase [unclassified Mesorhizobium]MBZ9965715.1 FAD-dependent oxidoreductase [Mesorhizobium sp. BR1-1-2]MCA0011832.1 FAD-dependent oxidoreductase [Mesorhizobium sp. B294B1A1]MCA0038086.1 FAD-dependent oxidoreductase [Mesorhizobium sp. B292B1B]
MKDGTSYRFDAIYLALGCKVRSQLAEAVGARCYEDGYVTVDEHQQTSIHGMYATGDAVNALNQIAIGFGQAAIAASHAHRELAPSRLDLQISLLNEHENTRLIGMSAA